MGERFVQEIESPRIMVETIKLLIAIRVYLLRNN